MPLTAFGMDVRRPVSPLSNKYIELYDSWLPLPLPSLIQPSKCIMNASLSLRFHPPGKQTNRHCLCRKATMKKTQPSVGQHGTADPVCGTIRFTSSIRIKMAHQCKESHHLSRGGGMFMPAEPSTSAWKYWRPETRACRHRQTVSYVALSYVGVQQRRVGVNQKVNIEQHRQSLPFSQLQLPWMRSTWLDAWISLIWVDALCIIQRRLLDWVLRLLHGRRLLQRLSCFGCHTSGIAH